MKLLIRNGKVLRTNDGSAIAVEEPRPPVQEQIDDLGDQVEILSDKQFVPLRLSLFPTTTGFRQNGSVYVDDGEIALRMPLTALKELNTKIIVTDDVTTVDMAKLTVDDFIYERNKGDNG